MERSTERQTERLAGGRARWGADWWARRLRRHEWPWNGQEHAGQAHMVTARETASGDWRGIRPSIRPPLIWPLNQRVYPCLHSSVRGSLGCSVLPCRAACSRTESFTCCCWSSSATYFLPSEEEKTCHSVRTRKRQLGNRYTLPLLRRTSHCEEWST